MMLWLLAGCLARQAPAYTWSWSPHAPKATLPGPRRGHVLAVFAGDGGKAHPDGSRVEDGCTPWNQDAVSLAIRAELKAGGSLFWLGDNVYPAQPRVDDGGSCQEKSSWAMSEATLTRQADAGYRTRAHFVPGNHDYAHRGRREAIEAQAGLIRQLGAVPLGYLEPVQTVDLGAVRMVAYDSERAIHDDPDGTLDALERAIDEAAAAGDRVALIAHHPMFSVGPHGYQPWRGLFTDTDLANRRYARWRERLLPRLQLWQAEHQVAISIGGHDHSLQLLQVDQGLYVTTGASSRTSPVRGAAGPHVQVHHAESSLGYAVLTEDDTGALAIELVAVRPAQAPGCEAIEDTGWFRCRVAARSF